MSIQTVNPNTNKNIKSFEEMNDKEVDATVVQAVKQSTETSPDALQDGLNINIQDTANVKEETTSQRRPQFRLSEKNKRR